LLKKLEEGRARDFRETDGGTQTTRQSMPVIMMVAGQRGEKERRMNSQNILDDPPFLPMLPLSAHDRKRREERESED
jgi:hypothetical protein